MNLGRESDEPPGAGLCPDDPTVTLTVLTGTTGVLAEPWWSADGDCALAAFGPSELPGLFPRVEDEREFRRLFRWLPLKLEL